jgi:flagellar biosynthetic protein FlhB
MAGERTEQASPRRRQKARAEGDRPRSRDLVAACATLAGTLTLGSLAGGWLDGWHSAAERVMALAASPSWRSEGGVAAMLELRAISVDAMMPLCGILLACAGAALAAGIGQGGGLSVNPAALQPKLTRLDPVSNLKNLFSLRAAARMGKTLLPVAALTVLAWGKLARQMEIPVFSQTRMPRVMLDSYDLLVDAAWILFVWSAVDYAIEYRSWSERLKMSKQELRDEYKETEGNPQIRGRIRNIQRQMRARMIRADVAKASVVITNPTHYAVALTFDFTTMDAPRVLVKGRNLVAEQIKSEARWAGVPIIENPPLARSLYKTVEPGQAIPFELYAAVAGILAYLYRQQVEERARKQAAAETAARPPAPRQGPAG